MVSRVRNVGVRNVGLRSMIIRSMIPCIVMHTGRFYVWEHIFHT